MGPIMREGTDEPIHVEGTDEPSLGKECMNPTIRKIGRESWMQGKDPERQG